MATTKKVVKKVAKKAVKKVVKPRVPTIPKHIFDRVDKGIQLLDILLGRKEWLSRMDLKEFDIKDTNTCVAGSVWAECYDFGEDGYDRFCALLNTLGGDGTAYKFGFNTDEDADEHDTQFQQLQDVWVRTIQHMKKRAR